MIRPARLRKTSHLRDALADVRLAPEKLILPLFVRYGQGQKIPIQSMPGHSQLTVDHLPETVEKLLEKGLKHLLLFGIPEHKDAYGSDSTHENGIIQQALKVLAPYQKDLTLITDVCFCEYTDHGHCGKLAQDEAHGLLDMEASCDMIAQQALSHAKAGSQVIAPSGMVDGMIGAIRDVLDANGFPHIPILSYAMKYASHFYGPFRNAAEGAPLKGDRKTYQADYRRKDEWLLETSLDVQQGADMLMVKPAGYYLDIVSKVKQTFPELPLVAYQVSGEYSMIHSAVSSGLLAEGAIAESLIAIHRAGADMIISYFTEYILDQINA